MEINFYEEGNPGNQTFWQVTDKTTMKELRCMIKIQKSFGRDRYWFVKELSALTKARIEKTRDRIFYR